MDRKSVYEGVTVRSRDGRKLGKVAACGEETFIVEKGFFFRSEHVAYYDDVDEIRDGEIYLAHSKAELASPGGAFPVDSSEESKRPVLERERDETVATTQGPPSGSGDRTAEQYQGQSGTEHTQKPLPDEKRGGP